MRISRAALELLRERGPQAVHIDAVAERSGVARTTIYRRFPNREALIAATLGLVDDAPFPSPELPVEDKLRWLLEQVQVLVEEQIGRGSIAAVLADSDPVFGAALRARLVARLEALQLQIDADVTGGRIRTGTNAEALASVLFGVYLGELLQHGRVRAAWADGVVDLVLRGVALPDRP